MKKVLPLSLLCLGIMGGAQAQTCSTTISTFPYVENFEAGAGGWTSGGAFSSWALGTPAKPVINSAASGTKAWVTNLTGNYSSLEQSYVESPCFNFTNVIAPIVEMKIWWNSEFSYDGAVLQSSIDNGITWQNVGVKGDPNNWYNDNTINAGPGGQPTSTAQGWTGRNSTSNGSGGWVLAKHDLTGLGGKPNVKLRIAFGADNVVHDEGFAFDNFTIYDTPANDASVTAINAPVSPVIPGSPVPVSVTVKNLGTSPLTSATLGFSVNGAVQPTFPWTGNITTGTTAGPVQIGTFAFPAGVHKIKAWSKLPNGLADGNATNDTTQITINSCNPLAGNFTINKNLAASATNFTSFTAAAQMLGNCGVSGPVTFTVAANSGPYNEQVILPVIPGTDATNTVTFEGNGNTIFPSATTTTSLMPGIVTFNGADYVRLRNLKIEADAAAANAWGVQLMNASDNNTISGCTVNMPLSNNGTLVNGIIAGSTSVTAAGNYANNLQLLNNTINGGYYGILLNGVISGVLTSGTRVIGNQVKDPATYGIYLNNCGTGTIVEGNDISRMNRVNGSSFYGIYLAGTNNTTTISKNRIHNTHDVSTSTTGSVYGIYSSSQGAAGTENIIKNNLIYNINNTGGITYALYNGSGNNTWYYHNTVSVDDPAVNIATLRGLYILGTTTGIRFINNILSLSGAATSKHAIYISSATTTLLSDYNDLYVGTAGNIGYFSGDKATLTDWKTANNNVYDQNSVSVDPVFVNRTYLQPLAPTVNNAGQVVTLVTDDINGAARSMTTPDPGAYEFTPAVTDAGVTSISAPTSPVMPGSQAVQVTLKNFGTANLTSAKIGWSVNGAVQPDYTWNGTLTNLQTATAVNIGNYTFVGGNYTIKAWSKNPNNTTDGLAVNDTTIQNVFSCAPLTGSFTINKNNPTGGTNFQSISEAAARLTSCGVSGPVTFAVAGGTGPYNEQVEFGSIPFTSAANTVTFEGNGNTITTTPGVKPGIVVLNGADYVKLNNFVITLPATAVSGWGVQLINAADNNTITNTTINLPMNTGSPNVNGIATGLTTSYIGNNASFLKLQNNTINGGTYGILINGNTGGTNATGCQITGNQMKDQFNYGIVISNTNGALVEGNDISRPTRTAVSTIYGIMLNGTCLNSVISKNRIHNTHDAATALTGSVYGIYNVAMGTPGNENIFKNNLLYNINNTGGSFYGIYLSSASGAYYYHNTIATDPTTSYVTLRGVYVTNAVVNVKFVNNVLSLPSNGTTKHGIYIGNTSASVISNNNDIYLGTSGITGYYSIDRLTLADWQGAATPAFDQNSTAADPTFIGLPSGLLKPTNVALDNTGQPVPAVTEDFLGAARNAASPDMGAYEFGVPANDVGIISVSGPSATGCGLSATENITVILKNFGAATQTSVPLTYMLNGTAIATPATWTGSMAPNDTALYTFTTKANLATSGTYRIIAKTMLGGDLATANDADTLDVVNSLITGNPGNFDFETTATGIAKFRKVVNANSNVTEGAGASNGAASTKGLILEGVTNPAWLAPAGVTDPWTNNPANFAGAYICMTPTAIAYPDSLWLTFDLKQLFKTANVNTNFRVTLNGTQVGPTYRPPFSGTGGTTNWSKVKVDLTAHKNAPVLMIGLESSVAEAYANGTGTANLIDNIAFVQHVAQPVSGVKENALAGQIRVFPNPSNGSFNVSLENGMDYTLKVTDLTGKVILTQKAKGDAKLNLEGAAKGIYLLTVTSENGSAVRKLIVE